MNPDTEIKKNILGENSFVHNGYKVSSEADPYCALGKLLRLGGANNTNGKLQIFDSQGNAIGTWGKNGINAGKGTFSGTMESRLSSDNFVKVANGGPT